MERYFKYRPNGGIRKSKLISHNTKTLINDYLAKTGVSENETIDDTIYKVINILSEFKNKGIARTASVAAQISTTSYHSCITALHEDLIQNKKKVVILLDSLDDFRLDLDEVGRVIQGLLKHIGESNSESKPIHIRFCLPSELFHVFKELSSNTTKDFRRQLVLHWVASELIDLAAHRYSMFCELYPENVLGISPVKGVLDKSDAHNYLRQILPRKFNGRLGAPENPIAYILRHTQLLPRHLIILLNSIWLYEKRVEGDSNGRLSEKEIRDGVAAKEGVIVDEICVAYRPVYPLASAVFSTCIPEMKRIFKIGDLEITFRRHGKKAMGTDEFSKFKRMFIEMGAIGRVTKITERYIHGEFEYTAPNKLVTSTDDFLCFHPLFSGVFRAKECSNIKLNLPVYPYGSRIEDEDFRDWD